MADTSLWVPGPPGGAQTRPSEAFMRPAREAIRHEHKLRMAYCDEAGKQTTRVVWPFALAFFEGRCILAGWCELRSSFRHFRIDRIAEAASTGERYPAYRRDLLARWRKELDIPADS